jgi:fluoroacetyl-CoA thioesterase
MTEKLEVGQTCEIEKRVTAEMTAAHFGNPGVEVFATPVLIAFLEQSCIQCIVPTLEDGQGSAGTRVDIQHLAATPVGMKVVARAELTEVDGRRLVFKVEARDEREQIAEGLHERFVIGSMAKFLGRAAEKMNTG